MKLRFRSAVAFALAAALLVPLMAAASPQARESSRDKTELVLRVINRVKKVFGVSANSDILTPPGNPTPPPPTTTTGP